MTAEARAFAERLADARVPYEFLAQRLAPYRTYLDSAMNNRNTTGGGP